MGLLATEDLQSMEWLIDTFQNQNSKWKQIRVILTDKDTKKRDIFRQKFPEAHLQFCLFHVMKSFEQEITCEKMSISPEQKQWAINHMTKLCHSCSEEEYAIHYSNFMKDAPGSVITYYDKNWHSIRKEWTFITQENGNFLNLKNNGLERLNIKFTSVVQKRGTLLSFIDNFFKLLGSLQRESESSAASVVLGGAMVLLKENSVKEKYFRLLRPYAFHLVMRQMETDIIITEEYQNNYCYHDGDQKNPVNLSFCSCNFFSSLRLPCCHIFGVRRIMAVPLFDKLLCEQKWTRDLTMLVDQDDNINTDNAEVEQEMQYETQEERLRIISPLMNELASLVSESSGAEFESKRKAIEDLLKCWKDGKRISYYIVDDADAPVTWTLQTQEADNYPEQVVIPMFYDDATCQ